MTADEFAQRLDALTPTEDELRREGVPESALSRFLRMYKCRVLPNPPSQESDPLVDLIQRYDLSTVEIGAIYLGRFQNWVSSPSHRIVGTLEADGLAIRKSDGMVVLLDHDCPSFVMAVVAADSGKALDAFLELAVGLKGLPSKSKAERLADAGRCAAASGVPDSLDFYASELGALG